MKLNIATYNIHKGVSPLRSLPRVHALKHAISGMGADVVFLQEVQGRHDRNLAQFGHRRHGEAHWPDEAQHEFLAGDSHHAAYGMNAVYDHGHHGNALLSAFPILSAENQDVSDHIFEQRGILHCLLHTPKLELHCYVVHFGLLAGGRGRQAGSLIETVRSTAAPDEPVIVAGDFNDWGNKLGHTLRKELGVAEVFDQYHGQQGQNLPRLGGLWRGQPERRTGPHPARTFPAAMPWLRLDRIYVRGFEVETAKVLSGAPWAGLSDHAPLTATLVLK